MKNLVITILVFCAFVCVAYSFQCYQCGTGSPTTSYTTDQCEKDQKKVNCTTNVATCMKYHYETEDGKEVGQRGCWPKASCEDIKKQCDDSDKRKEMKIKECAVACCDTDLCNKAFSASIDMMLIVAAVLCSLKLS